MSDLQIQRCYKQLQKAGNKGVRNYEFSNNRLLRYSSYISDLRDDGHVITAEREFLPNGRATNVWVYKLVK